MPADKIPASRLTDYQRGRIAELCGAGGNYTGSMDGMPLVVIPNVGAFAIPPRKHAGVRKRKELLRVTRVDLFADIAD